MDNKVRCQSCGMPLAAEFKNLGTNADGSAMGEYCIMCFRDGKFTMPDLTIEGMIRLSIDNMTNELKMPVEQATKLANEVIPNLRRWRTK